MNQASPNRMDLPVSGMKCASCAGRVEKAVAAVAGVEKAAVNLATATVTVEGTAPFADLAAAVRDIGFGIPETRESFAITGLSCASCVKKAEDGLAAMTGVLSAQVNLASGVADVTYVPQTVSYEDMQKTAAGLGYGLARPQGSEEPADVAEREREREYAEIWQRLRVGAVMVGALFVLVHWNNVGLGRLLPLSVKANQWLQFLLITPVQFWVGWLFHKSAWAAVRHGSANMHTLVSVGTFSAYLYSLLVLLAPGLFAAVKGITAAVYFDTAGAIIVLILLGRFLEIRAKGRTSQAIRKLMDLSPKTARVIRGGQEVEVPLSEVRVGDRVVVKPGERVPVDGQVVAGESTLDESMLTGESMPVAKSSRDTVVGGTINLTGSLTLEARKVGRDTVLARIVEMVRRAQGSKPPIARLADRIASWFVPAVMVVALLTFLAWWLFGPAPALTYALLNFISVLIIACPCALGLATPTSIMVGTGKGAEHGILIKGGEALETTGKVTAVVFDKTGTLTQGKLKLTDFLGDDETLSLAASGESRSEHPIAKAIVVAAKLRGLAVSTPDSFTALAGRGVQAKVAGKSLLVGTRRLLDEMNVPWSDHQEPLERLEKEGKTAMLVAVEGRVTGILAVADTVRAESHQAVSLLKDMGIEVALLTGDNRRTAAAIAQELGIERVMAEVLPETKSLEIERLQAEGKVVAMVGDGINDAPALAQANVGLAIGSGTDVAMEAADITLMADDPRAVVTAIRLSRATMTNIRQNLFWAFAYNVILIPLAAGVWWPLFGILLSPIFAAAAMGLSSVTVVTNALRLSRFNPN